MFNGQKLKYQGIQNPLGVILLPSFKERGMEVIKHIHSKRANGDDYLIDAEAPVFADGARKAEIKETIRGRDIFVLGDVTNYGVTYNMYGQKNRMSPYDHFQDFKNVLSAVAPSGVARKSVVIPFLIDGRQHRRKSRESLSCAYSLQELENYGVENIITADAHDADIQNAVPGVGFHNIIPTVTLLKEYIKEHGEVDPEKLVILAPDLGAMRRAGEYARPLGSEIGYFHKVRDITKIEDGSNPITRQTYIGDGNLKDRKVLIVDDMISGGDTILKTAVLAKGMGASDVSAMVAFGLFTKGFKDFQQAYEQGVINRVYCTNLSYIPTEAQQENDKWLSVVDATKLLANVIDALNKNESVTRHIRGNEEKLYRNAHQTVDKDDQTI